MEDHALAKEFPRIAEAIVRITVQWRDCFVYGTGLLVGVGRKTGYRAIVTSGHVLRRPEGADSEAVPLIRLDRFDGENELIGTITCPVVAADEDAGIVSVFCNVPGVDLGVMRLAGDAEGAVDFFDPRRRGDRLPRFASESVVPAPATRVAWAGFPHVFCNLPDVGSPLLSYYEGSVACVYQRGDYSRLILDGHCLKGVSGGPLWFYSDTDRAVCVAGIVSQYLEIQRESHDLWEDPGPGFVLVQPIYPVLSWMEKWGKPDMAT